MSLLALELKRVWSPKEVEIDNREMGWGKKKKKKGSALPRIDEPQDLPMELNPVRYTSRHGSNVDIIEVIFGVRKIFGDVINLEFTIWWYKGRLDGREVHANHLGGGVFIGELSTERLLVRSSSLEDLHFEAKVLTLPRLPYRNQDREHANMPSARVSHAMKSDRTRIRFPFITHLDIIGHRR